MIKVLFLLLPICATSQKLFDKQFFAGSALCFASGAANGVRETVSHHYSAFEARFPEADDQFANPDISWKNKYKNYDEGDTRARFPGSKTALVWTTDLYHLSNTMSKNALMLGSMTFAIGERRPAWHYAAKFIAGGVAYSVGFHTIYTFYFK